MALVLTMGEPAGIASEITMKAWKELRDSDRVFFVVGDAELLRAWGDSVAIISSPSEAREVFSSSLPVFPLTEKVESCANVPDSRNGRAVLESIEMCVEFCQQGVADGMVTNPIHKAVLRQGGFRYSGHTDYLAYLCGVRQERVVMMLVNSFLRTVPLTVHEPLARVPEILTSELIKETSMIVANSLKNDFAIKEPRLAVAGLNPHAGEDGEIGTEEVSFINDTIIELQKTGLDIQGSFAADSLFSPLFREKYDVAICMYHDQALIPIKTLDFDNAVNVSLGLPIIRTSVDHGSACDIKDKGIASPQSLIAAINLAHELAMKKHD